MRGGVVIRDLLENGGIILGVISRFLKETVYLFDILRVGRGGFKNDGGKELAQACPVGRIAALPFGRPLQRLSRFFFVTDRLVNLIETLISIDIGGIEADGMVYIIDGLLGFLQVFGVNEGELEIGLGRLGVGFDGVF